MATKRFTIYIPLLQEEKLSKKALQFSTARTTTGNQTNREEIKDHPERVWSMFTAGISTGQRTRGLDIELEAANPMETGRATRASSRLTWHP